MIWKTIATAAATMALGVSNANAAWTNTHWGMSLNEIRALYPDTHEKVDTGFTQMPYQVASMTKPYLGLAWREVDFTFGPSGLDQVVALSDSSPATVAVALRKSYGAPTSTDKTPLFERDVFHDPASGDQIIVMSQSPAGSILIVSPANGGVWN